MVTENEILKKVNEYWKRLKKDECEINKVNNELKFIEKNLLFGDEGDDERKIIFESKKFLIRNFFLPSELQKELVKIPELWNKWWKLLFNIERDFHNKDFVFEIMVMFLIDLKNTDLSNTNLRGVILKEVDLTGCDFSNSDLSYADLSFCDLYNVKFNHCNLQHTNLLCSNIKNADFSFADLQNTETEVMTIEGNVKFNKVLIAEKKSIGFFISKEGKKRMDFYRLRKSVFSTVGYILEKGKVISEEGKSIYKYRPVYGLKKRRLV